MDEITQEIFEKKIQEIDDEKDRFLEETIKSSKNIWKDEQEDICTDEYNGMKIGDRVRWNNLEEFSIDIISLTHFGNFSPRFWSNETRLWYLANNCKKI